MFTFTELQERLALSRGYVGIILGRQRPFHFDRIGLGRLLGMTLEIALESTDDLDNARAGGADRRWIDLLEAK